MTLTPGIFLYIFSCLYWKQFPLFRSHYEGSKVFVLQSVNDQTITKDRCGHYISELAKADKVVTVCIHE